MADVFDRAFRWLAKQDSEQASRLIEYKRPGVTSCELSGSRGRSTFEVDRGASYSEQIETYDWRVDPNEILLGAEPVEPQAGDLIIELTNTERRVYQVLAVGNGPCWRWTNSYRTRIRIHTKLISTKLPQPTEEA